METKTFYSGKTSQSVSFTEAGDNKVFVGRENIYFKGTEKKKTKEYASFLDIKPFWDYVNTEECWYSQICMTIIDKQSIKDR